MAEDSRSEKEPSPFAEWLDGMARAFGYPRDADLARKLQLRQSTVSRWRKGARPSVEHLLRVAALFGTDVTVLLKLAGYIPMDFELDEMPEPPSAKTETVRRITDAELPEVLKDVLYTYWEQRLKEERGRVYSMIEAFAERPDKLLPDLTELLPELLETSLPEHVMEVLKGLSGPRLREGWLWPEHARPTRDSREDGR